MEAFPEDLVVEPARDGGAAYSGHFFGAGLEGGGVDEGDEPVGEGFPVFADGEGDFFDCAVEALEASDVLAVVERGFGLREALVGEGVLELLDLGLLVEVEAFDFLILDDCGALAWRCGGRERVLTQLIHLGQLARLLQRRCAASIGSIVPAQLRVTVVSRWLLLLLLLLGGRDRR